MDTAIARQSGLLEAVAKADGHDPGMADSLIAGTALVRDLCVVTHNIRHFKVFGVQTLSPAQDIGGT